MNIYELHISIQTHNKIYIYIYISIYEYYDAYVFILNICFYIYMYIHIYINLLKLIPKLSRLQIHCFCQQFFDRSLTFQIYHIWLYSYIWIYIYIYTYIWWKSNYIQYNNPKCMFYNTKAKSNHESHMKMNVVQYSIKIKQGHKYFFFLEYHIPNTSQKTWKICHYWNTPRIRGASINCGYWLQKDLYILYMISIYIIFYIMLIYCSIYHFGYIYKQIYVLNFIACT
jgi:hypothetical protein